MIRLDTSERRRRLGRRHFLSHKTTSVETAAGGLVGLHSSDPATVYLSCRARIDEFQQKDLELALYDDRTLLRMLGMRRTMFVVPHDLGGTMDVACAQQLLDAERRRLIRYLEAQPGFDAVGPWLADVESRTMAALDRLGAATARELKAEVPELALKLNIGSGQFGLSTRVLFLLATANQIIRAKPLGGWTSTQYRWVRTDRWLAKPFRQMSEPDAQADLVRRWLLAFGPGTLTDVKWWTGWGVGVTKRALHNVGAVEVALDDDIGYVLPDDLSLTPDVDPWAALLPGLDPTTMGWKDREWYLGGHRQALFDRNGNAGPSVWVNGRVVGGWAFDQNGDVQVSLLEPVTELEKKLVDDEAMRLQDWLGDKRFVPRFRTPTERALVE